MAEEAPFSVLQVNALIWPASLQLPVKHFRLFVAADTTKGTTDEISRFAEDALSRGMVYFCAWGPGCERFHDIVDEVGLGARNFAAPTSEDVVMTTWHEHEPLEEALDFFTTAAVPAEAYAVDSHYWVVICVGNPEWASIATSILKAAALQDD